MTARPLLPALLLSIACAAPSETPPGAHALAAVSDSPLRTTVENGQLRLVNGHFAVTGDSLEASARQFLTAHASELGLSNPRTSLTLLATRHGRSAEYLRFGQQVDGLEVFDGQVVVKLDSTGHTVLAANLALRPTALNATLGEDRGAAKSQADALSALKMEAPFHFGPETTRGIWAPKNGTPALAYRVRASTVKPRAAWEAFIDAATGEVLTTRNRLHAVSGTGMVFDPNPVVTTGDLTLRDNNDATNAELDGARFAVTLPRLDGSGYTRGTYADAQTLDLTQRVQSATNDFSFTRDQSFSFEQVMAYFHIDRVQDRIQTQLGFTNVNNRVQVMVVDAQSDDNSFYDDMTTEIDYGTGGVDDAEDADILTHEYGHSIQDNQVPGFGNDDEGSMGEGFGDYLGASMQLELGTQAGRPNNADPKCVGDWDSTSYSPPCLRRTDSTKHWPEAGDGEVHDDGEMWSASLWSIRTLFGADVMDSVVIESHFLLSTSDSFQVASDALLTADDSLYDGGHVTAMRRVLVAQGVSRDLTTVTANSVLSTVPVSIDNPRGSNNKYASNLDDVQTYTVPGAAGLQVHFTQIETETDSSCLDGACDNIYLTNADGDLFQVLNGAQMGVTSATIAGQTVNIRLVSDSSVNKFGYHVDQINVVDLIDGGTVVDAGSPDAGLVDAGFDGGTVVDAGSDGGIVVDAGFDGGSTDDAGPGDAGVPDAGELDAGTSDAGPDTDAGSDDAGIDQIDGGGGAGGGTSATGGGAGGGSGGGTSATGGGTSATGGGTSATGGGGGSSKTLKNGCGCNAGSGLELWALGAAALGLVRRRRVR